MVFARGPGRPIKRRTRTFRPNYLSFAGTYQCNLTLPNYNGVSIFSPV
jgi:hypothetical protein